MKCSSVRSSFIASKMLKAVATATVGAVATAAGTSLIFVFSRDGKCWRRCEPTDTD